MSAQIFVGNIPYDATEQELAEVFSQAGPVKSFRLVFERTTGKPKGFGFCEYADEATALSAMRNLAGVEFHGRRLRVDYAESAQRGSGGVPLGPEPSRGDSHGGSDYGGSGFAQGGPSQQRESFPSELGASAQSLATPESVQEVLSELDQAQLYEIVAKARMLVQQQPDAARQLFAASPALAYSLLHAQSMLGIISVDAVQQILSGGAAPVAGGAAMPAPPVAPVGAPVAQGGLQADVAALPEDQQALLATVMQLSDAQIAELPPAQQQQVLALRQQLLQA